MTSFASQVYPVLGLCEFTLATDANPPNEVARVCELLVEYQGGHGQWWWLYSTRARKIIEGYPVYSVHQDAMASMALLLASRVLGKDYRPPLIAGLRWVTGDNELGESLVDREAGLIYRAIQRRGGDADGLAGWSRRQRRAAFLAALTNRTRRAPTEFDFWRVPLVSSRVAAAGSSSDGARDRLKRQAGSVWTSVSWSEHCAEKSHNCVADEIPRFGRRRPQIGQSPRTRRVVVNPCSDIARAGLQREPARLIGNISREGI